MRVIIAHLRNLEDSTPQELALRFADGLDDEEDHDDEPNHSLLAPAATP